ILKIAFLAPPGSQWDLIFKKMAMAVDAQTHHDLRLRFIGGGVMGDEPDEVRKMRIGQLQGAALTGMGLGLVDPEVRVLELPMLYRSDSDVDRATARVEGELAAQFARKGYVMLGWAEVGPVYLFTNKPIHKVSDMQGVKMWMWEGDKLAQAIFQQLRIVPQPLAITDVLTSLETGMIDGAYNAPQGLIALQWNSKVKYMLDLRLTQSIGALVVTERAWDALSPSDQLVLRQASQRYCREIVVEGRKDNARALAALRAQGIQLTELAPSERAKIVAAANRVDQDLVGKLYSAALLNQVKEGIGH
ncbi:MAG: TRAP transporter substrate-binding protein DctP, partial [Cyanobacteria bacterium REEB65]|nr:TRAP transporter substrate-binding protein DctP [Cyanobacteria bacterium REEB65]